MTFNNDTSIYLEGILNISNNDKTHFVKLEYQNTDLNLTPNNPTTNIRFDFSGATISLYTSVIELVTTNTPGLLISGMTDSNSSITAASFNTKSDYRIKENVNELNETYYVDNLRPVEYENTLINKKSLGFIAHEVQEQYPFLVNGEKDGKENQSINYQELIPILVKEIKDLKKRVTILEKLN